MPTRSRGGASFDTAPIAPSSRASSRWSSPSFVQTTMREANDRGYECLLVEDATESYFASFKQATLEMVRAQGGIVGWTASFAAVRDALP